MTSYCTPRLPHALVNAHATSSMTSPCLRHRLFLSAASYLFLPHFVTFCWISLRHTYFTRLRRHSNSIKRQHKTRFTHSPTQQRQRHYSSSARQLQRHYYIMASNNIDELQNLERIEELCRNLRQQQERQRNQHSPPIVTPTGWFLLCILKSH